MTRIQRPPRPRTDFSRVSTATLIAAVARLGARPNIRLMEELLARPEAWKEASVVAVLNYCVSNTEEGDSAVASRGRLEETGPESNPVWIAVVAGAMRAPGAVPALLRMLRRVPESDAVASLVAAESLARIGGPAVDGVAELAESGDWCQRIWAYASLGWNADPRAGRALLAALSEQRVAMDAIVNALADRRDAAVIPALRDALRSCEPDLRLEIEDAIRDLHRGNRDRPIDWDWRLRYLQDPDRGQIDFGWAGAAVIFREDDGSRPRLGEPSPVRTLDEILAEGGPPFGVRADPDGNPLCQCCDARMWVRTGVWVCPATAMTVAWIQDRWLTRARDEGHLDDLFDVLEVLEEEQEALWDERPRPASPWDQDQVAPDTAIVWAWHGIAWLIEQGIEEVDAGRERLREEATRLLGLEVLTKRARGSPGRPSLN